MFKLVPCVFANSILLGVPLSTPKKVSHCILHVIACFFRALSTYYAVKDVFVSEAASSIALTMFVSCSLEVILFFLLLNKANAIISFLSSDSSLALKLKKIDLLLLPGCFCSVFLMCLPMFASESFFNYSESIFGAPFFNSRSVPQRIWVYISTFFFSLIYQSVPLAVILYSLGYCVLHHFKVNILNSIANGWQMNTFHSIMVKLQSVTKKHEEFESIFGPFLLVCLGYNFIAVVCFIYFLNLAIVTRNMEEMYTIAGELFIQLSTMGLIFVISIYNEKLRQQFIHVQEQMELLLVKNSGENTSLITYLLSKLDKSINEPLTACKLINIRRHVLLSIATSCVTFAVLLIQINSGNLTSSSSETNSTTDANST